MQATHKYTQAKSLQRVLIDVNNAGQRCVYPVEQSNMYRFEESNLELSPLLQITDEDAIELAKLASRYTGRINIKERIPGGIRVNKVYVSVKAMFRFKDMQYYEVVDGKYVLTNSHRNIEIYDYLRSKGYALPLRGLSVDEIVEAGWIKLKEN